MAGTKVRNWTLLKVGGVLLAGVLALGTAAALAQTPAGPGGPNQGPGGRQGWGPGGMMGGMMGMMHGAFGSTMGGPGMMGGSGPGGMMGMMGGWQAAQPAGDPLTIQKAAEAVRNALAPLGNADLVLDEVMEFDNHFHAIVQEKSTGRGAYELLVNRWTGAVFPEFGPNMMWNTKYGHMAGFGAQGGMMSMMGGAWSGGCWNSPSGSSATGQSAETATIDAGRATELARQWLATNLPGTTADHPDEFYGYYTLHTLKDGKISGMLSVNATTGQVWYHSWHGTFVRELKPGA